MNIFKIFYLALITCLVLHPNASVAADTAMVLKPANEKYIAKTIAYVDVKRIIENSKAGQTAKKELENLKSKYEKEIKSEDSTLKKRQEELQKQKKALSEEAFKKKVNEFKKRIESKEKDVLKKHKVLEAAYFQSLQHIKEETFEVIKDISENKSIDLVLASSELVYAKDHLDITSEVIIELNKRITKIDLKVKR